MNPFREYEVRRLDGTVFQTTHFVDLPPKFKALAWLYADYKKDSHIYGRLMIMSLVRERTDQVYYRR